MQGMTPGSKHAIENAVKLMALSGGTGIAKTRYAQSGRSYGADGGKNKLSETEEAKLVEYVKRWRPWSRSQHRPGSSLW